LGRGRLANNDAARRTSGDRDGEDCGEAISFRRLLARPVTTLCIDCKEQSEREEQATEQAGRAGGFSELGEGSEGEVKLPAEE